MGHSRLKKNPAVLTRGRGFKNGADERNRTGDLRFTKALLYQLSYISKLFQAPTVLTSFTGSIKPG